MRMTPARAHRDKVLAAIATQQALEKGENPHGDLIDSEFAALMHALAEHKRSLKSIQSSEAKGKYKAKAVQDFDGWVAGVLSVDVGENGTDQGENQEASGQGNPYLDELFTTLMIWQLDAGNYEKALEMFTYALKAGMKLPAHFHSTMPVFMMDAFSKAALNKNDLGENTALILEDVVTLTEGIDAPDPARANLIKAYAYALIGHLGVSSNDYRVEDASTEPETAQYALDLLKRAQQLDRDKAQCVKDMEKLGRWLKKHELQPQLEAETLDETETSGKPARKTTTRKTAKVKKNSPHR